MLGGHTHNESPSYRFPLILHGVPPHIYHTYVQYIVCALRSIVRYMLVCLSVYRVLERKFGSGLTLYGSLPGPDAYLVAGPGDRHNKSPA
jgi:hypothetical protein